MNRGSNVPPDPPAAGRELGFGSAPGASPCAPPGRSFSPRTALQCPQPTQCRDPPITQLPPPLSPLTLPPPHSNHFPFSALRDGSSLPDPTHHFSSQRVCVGVNPCFFPFALCISGLHIGLQRGLVCNRAYTLERALHKQPWHNAHPTMPTPKAVGSRGTGTCHVTCVSHT